MWVFRKFLHGFTLTRLAFQHGAMQGMWRKTHLPHRNRQRKTMQTPKATAPTNLLVVPRKRKMPHKKRKQKTENSATNKKGTAELCGKGQSSPATPTWITTTTACATSTSTMEKPTTITKPKQRNTSTNKPKKTNTNHKPKTINTTPNITQTKLTQKRC